MQDRTKLRLIRGALLLAGVFLLAAPWHDWLAEQQVPPARSESIGGLLKGIGEALIVALVLELVVDARLKRRLVQEAIHEVAPRILARLLPENVFRYIEEHLLQARLVRRSWNITYRITRLQDHQNFVRLETTSVYEMANVAASPAHYQAVYEVELPSFPEIGPTEITSITVLNLLVQPPGNLVFRYPNGADPKDAPKVAGDYVVFSKRFKIPVHKTFTATRFEFKSVEHFPVGSITPFFAKYVVEVAQLRIVYPKDSLRVIVDFPANEESELSPQEPPKGDDVYVFPKPLLPGQGFTVRFPRA